ncbi:PAS domain S-box protein [Paenibacillus ferrarius]|uniref:PAS domain S-box protein n=1 Tax=Paenibacillus ferrarius TaxID=1469647 RepID=UPI003D2840D5
MTAALDQLPQTLVAQAFHYSPRGMALVSIEGTILQANPMICSILGLSDSEIINKSFQEFMPEDDFFVLREF